MNTKSFLILYYSLAGILIALFTAIMTYLIIGVPIGEKMMFKIFLTIIATLPIIGILSYVIGVYFSKRFAAISSCLNRISEDRFLEDKHQEKIKDISAIHHSIHQLSNRLQESILKLKRNNKQLNHMILSLSHDIKTPLTIIEGYLEELEDDIVSPDERPKVISILKKETAYINELSSEVIHYIQTLDIKPKKVMVPLKSFVHEEVCPLLRMPQSVKLKCEINDDVKLEFDPMALKNILVNLLHNASKYTHEGSITVQSDGQNITIEDTGIGIDKENQTMIFEPFYCIDQSKNREKSGFGLGLSIAKNLALSNNYDLTYDQCYKKGSRFLLNKQSS